MKKQATAAPDIDPTKPSTTVRLKDTEYPLTFTFRSLAIVERKLAEIGLPINVFAALDFSDVPSAAKLGILLYAALQPNYPEMSYYDVVGKEASADSPAIDGLLTMRNASAAYSAICAAYAESMVDPEDAPKKA